LRTKLQPGSHLPFLGKSASSGLEAYFTMLAFQSITIRWDERSFLPSSSAISHKSFGKQSNSVIFLSLSLHLAPDDQEWGDQIILGYTYAYASNAKGYNEICSWIHQKDKKRRLYASSINNECRLNATRGPPLDKLTHRHILLLSLSECDI
jgi:hypothetical protein